MSARPDTAEHIVVEFDQPQAISRLVYEVEETRRERTQEVRVEASDDGGPDVSPDSGSGIQFQSPGRHLSARRPTR